MDQIQEILQGLNEQQKCAVSSPSNVLQVLAPPGSGKTKTLTTRVAYHIAHDRLKPWNIIVCTFTIKAAREMKERIRSFIGEELERKLILGTFHSVARRYLSVYGHHIGISKHFGVADSKDQENIIRRIIKVGNYSMEPRKAKSRISRRKSQKTQVKTAPAKMNVEQQEFEAIFYAYEDEMSRSNLLDYDDLLLRCVDLLNRHPECVSNIEAVLIDEFQDTNHVQYDLMNLLAQHRRIRQDGQSTKITIVGDPDQSIYSFRSAEIKNLSRMKAKYPETICIHLEENYRSSGSILKSAVEVIEQDTERPPKRLLATHDHGLLPILRTLSSNATEAAWIVGEIRRSHHLSAGLLNFSDYAILLRSASLSRPIETELGKAGVPYRMVSGHKFFDRLEVRILLDYLRVVSQPTHTQALLRVINVPSRQVGDVATNQLQEECEAKGLDLWTLVKGVAQGTRKTKKKLSSQATKGLGEFVNVILKSQQKLQKPGTTISDVLAHIMQKIGYETYMKSKWKEEYEERTENVDELCQLAASGKVFAEQEVEFLGSDGVEQQQHGSTTPSELLAQFLSNIALATDATSDQTDASGEQAEKVQIFTMHASKGLEFPVVFIPGAYEGSIPHSRSDEIDEERRLLYVGMTRAKALLYLSWPKKNGHRDFHTLSQFLSSPAITCYFSSKGPSFRYETIQGLAKVLGREDPSELEVIQQLDCLDSNDKSAIRTEDNYYPEDGEDLEERNTFLEGGLIAAESAATCNTTASKKRKFNEDASSRHILLNPLLPASNFASARQYFGNAKINEYHHNPSRFTSPELVEAKRVKVAEEAKPQLKGRKNVQEGQVNLLSFFSQSAPEKASASMDKPAPSAATIVTRTESVYSQPTARIRQSTVFSSSSVRRLPNKIALSRPRPLFDKEEEPSRHVLLSSSPTKPDPPEDDATSMSAQVETIGQENATADTFASNSMLSGLKPVTTLHRTSMQNLANGINRNAPKRPLGSRAGLSAFVNKPFSKPAKRPR